MTEFKIMSDKQFYDRFQAPIANNPKYNALVPEMVALAFPEDAEKAKAYAEYLIEHRKQWDKAEKEHPEDFPGFWVTAQEPFKVPDHGQDSVCICRFLAEKRFYAWFETTESWKKAEAGTHAQIDAYYKSLAKDPDRKDTVLTNIKDGYEHWRTAKKIDEASKLLKGDEWEFLC